MITVLSSFTAWDWTCIGLGSWLLLLGVGAVSIGRGIRRADEAEQPEVASTDDFLGDVPAEVLAVDELDRRFFAIVDAETRWFA